MSDQKMAQNFKPAVLAYLKATFLESEKIVFTLFDVLGIALFLAPGLAAKLLDDRSLVQLVGGGIFLLSFIVANYVSYKNLLGQVQRDCPFAIRLFAQTLGDNFPDSQRWCLIHPGTSDEFAFFPLAFEIANRSHMTLSDIVVFIRVPSVWLPDLPIESNVFPKLHEGQLRYSIDRFGGMAQISYSLPSLNPRTRVTITQGFAFQPTVNMPVVVEDIPVEGGTADVHLSFHAVIPVSIVAEARDSLPHLANLEVECLSAQSVDEGIEKYKEWWRKIQSQRLSSASPFERLALAFGKEERMVINFIGFSVEQEMETDNKRFYWLSNPDTQVIKQVPLIGGPRRTSARPQVAD
jgi:hypothetical protein